MLPQDRFNSQQLELNEHLAPACRHWPLCVLRPLYRQQCQPQLQLVTNRQAQPPQNPMMSLASMFFDSMQAHQEASHRHTRELVQHFATSMENVVATVTKAKPPPPALPPPPPKPSAMATQQTWEPQTWDSWDSWQHETWQAETWQAETEHEPQDTPGGASSDGQAAWQEAPDTGGASSSGGPAQQHGDVTPTLGADHNSDSADDQPTLGTDQHSEQPCEVRSTSSEDSKPLEEVVQPKLKKKRFVRRRKSEDRWGNI